MSMKESLKIYNASLLEVSSTDVEAAKEDGLECDGQEADFPCWRHPRMWGNFLDAGRELLVE